MTDTLEKLQQIKRSHDYYSRLLTFAVVAVFCLLGLILWWKDVPLPDHLKPLIGFLIMFTAFLVYKIPHLVYLLNCRRFRDHPDCLRLMGSWKEYKRHIS